MKTIASLLTAFLFLLTPFAAYGVAADHGGDEQEHCTGVFPPNEGAFDESLCGDYVLSLGPQPAAECADGANGDAVPADDASDDPLWLQACTLAFSLAGVNGITVEFHDHVDVDGSPDDHDGDGRPDVAKVLIPLPVSLAQPDDPLALSDYGDCGDDEVILSDEVEGEPTWFGDILCDAPMNQAVYLQLDFFYTPDQYGERRALPFDHWRPADEFDIPITGVMTYSPDDGTLLNSGDNYRFTNHYNHDLATRSTTFTPHYGIYQAASPPASFEGHATTDDDTPFGTCLICIEPANNRLAILAGPATWVDVDGDDNSQGMLQATANGLSIDLDTADEDSIKESLDADGNPKDPFGQRTIALLNIGILPDVPLGFPGDPDLHLGGLLHIKEPSEERPLYYQYSNLDDDEYTDFQELTCPGQPTNPTNPDMHCDDWDGDGLDNADDNDPRTPLTLFEILGSPSGEAPLTSVQFTFRCLDQRHDEAITFSGPTGWTPSPVGPQQCSVGTTEMAGSDPRREGTVTFTHAGALNSGADGLTVPGFEMTATYSGAPDTKSATATILGNAIEPGTLRVEITHRDGSEVSGAVYEAEANSGSATLTIPDYIADENGETHGFAVELTWTPDTSAEGQETTSVRFGTSGAANCNSPTSFLTDSDSTDGFTATQSIAAQDAGHTVRYCVERTDTGGRTGWADPRIDVVVPEKNLINAIPALSAPDDQHVETANDEATVAFKIEVTDTAAAGQDPDATGGEAPTEGPNLYWFKGTAAAAAAATPGDFTKLEMGEPETCPQTPTEITPHPAFCTDPPTTGVGASGPTSTPPANNNGAYDDGERHVANVQIPWTADDAADADIQVWYFFDVTDAAGPAVVDDNTGLLYSLDPEAAPLEFMGQDVLPNPISMLLRPECSVGSTEPTCYDDIANPFDIATYRDNEGNLISEDGANDQIDLVEQYLLSVDAPGEGTGGRAAVHWYSTKDAPSGIVTPDETESGRISVGDSDLTEVTEIIVAHAHGDWFCVFTDDGTQLPAAVFLGQGASEAAACDDRAAGSDYRVEVLNDEDGVTVRVIEEEGSDGGAVRLEAHLGSNPYDSYLDVDGVNTGTLGENLDDLTLGGLGVGFQQREDGTWWITLVNPDSCPTIEGVPDVTSTDCEYEPFQQAPGQDGGVPAIPDADGDLVPDPIDQCPGEDDLGEDCLGGGSEPCDPETDPTCDPQPPCDPTTDPMACDPSGGVIAETVNTVLCELGLGEDCEGGDPCDPETDPTCDPQPPCDPTTDPMACDPSGGVIAETVNTVLCELGLGEDCEGGDPCDPETDPTCEPPCDPSAPETCDPTGGDPPVEPPEEGCEDVVAGAVELCSGSGFVTQLGGPGFRVKVAGITILNL